MHLLKRHRSWLCSVLVVSVSLATKASAAAKTAEELTVALDTIWVVLTAALVFFMNLGFALVESGFCRAKNTVNILSKNFIVFAISCLAFYLFGWGLMFGNGSGFVGLEGLFMVGGADNSPATGDAYTGAYKAIAWTGVPLYAKFFFQLVFAGTAATIVSGLGGRAHQVPLVHRLLVPAGRVRLSDHRPLDLGRRLAGDGGLLGLRRFDRRAQRRRLGGAGRHPRARTAPRQVRRRTARCNAIPAHSMTSARHRLLRAVARLVRVQSRLDDGRGSERDLAHLHDDEHGRRSWRCSRRPR